MRRYSRVVIGSPPAVQTWESPASIDNTGVVNVSAALSAWFAATGAPGDTLKLRRAVSGPGVYSIPGGVLLNRNLHLDLNGCWLIQGSTPLMAPTLDIAASNIRLFSTAAGARVQGAAREAAFRGSEPCGMAYVAANEIGHAIRVFGANIEVDLTQIAAEFCFGDGVYVKQGSIGTRIHGVNLGPSVVQTGLGGTLSGVFYTPDVDVYPGVHHTARHGVAFTHGIDLTVDGISGWHNGRAFIDLEPMGAGEFINGVQVRNTESGNHLLIWIPGAGFRSASNVVIADNISYDFMTMDTRHATATERHSNWQVLRNTGFKTWSNTSRALFELDRIDGLEIRDNFHLVGTTTDAVDPGGSTGVVISPVENIQFPVPETQFVLGETKPNATNTGLTATPTVISTGGAITFSANDQVIENTRFERRVSVTGKRVTFRNCEFVGPPDGSIPNGIGLLTCTSLNVEDLLIDRCRFRPQFIRAAIYGIFGQGFTARRCDLSGTEDGIDIHRSDGGVANVTMEGNYIHDLAFHSPHPTTSDNQSHCDGSQMHPPGGARGVTYFGNTIVGNIDTTIGDWEPPVFDGSGNLLSGYPNYPDDYGFSPIQFGSDTANPLENVLINKNWIDSGRWGINCGLRTTCTNFQITNNRWGRAFGHGENGYIIKKAALPAVITGNEYEDTGAPANGFISG